MNLIAFYNEYKVLSIVIIIILVILFFISIALGIGGLAIIIVAIVKSAKKSKSIEEKIDILIKDPKKIEENIHILIQEKSTQIEREMNRNNIFLTGDYDKKKEMMENYLKSNKEYYIEEIKNIENEQEQEAQELFREGFKLSDDPNKRKIEMIVIKKSKQNSESGFTLTTPKDVEKYNEGYYTKEYIISIYPIDEVIKFSKMNIYEIRDRFLIDIKDDLKISDKNIQDMKDLIIKGINNIRKYIEEKNIDYLYKSLSEDYTYSELVIISYKFPNIIQKEFNKRYNTNADIGFIKKLQEFIKKS